jgi:hypothetical protein
MSCCTIRKQIAEQELEVFVKARRVLNYDLRQILVKSRSPHAKAAVERIDQLADEWDKLNALHATLRSALT